MAPPNGVSAWHIFVQQTLHSASCSVSGLPEAASSAAEEAGRSLWQGILRRSSRGPLFADLAASPLDAATSNSPKRRKKRAAASGLTVSLPEDAPLEVPGESPTVGQNAFPESASPASPEVPPEADEGKEAPSQTPTAGVEEGAEDVLDEEARAEEARRAARREARRARRAAAALGEDLPQDLTPEELEREQKKEGEKEKEDLRNMAEAMQQLTPEEREQVYAWHWKDGLDKRKVKVGGKKVLLAKVMEGKYDIIRDMGGFEPLLDNRTPIDRREAVPSEGLRPGAEKMDLRLEEHLRLPLDLLGRGNAFRTERWLGYLRGGQRDYAFGVYGRRQAVENVLSERWANREPEDVLFDELFYQDIIDQADKMELTLMAVATRPLPFEPLRDAFIQRLQKSMATAPTNEFERLQLAEQANHGRRLLVPDHVELATLYHAFDKERMQNAGLVDEKGDLKEGSHLIFSALDGFRLGIEGVQPGTIRERKSVIIGTFESPLLTRSVFDLFLGPFPINAQSKLQVGQGALYAANGFTFDVQTAAPNQFLDDKKGPLFDDHFSAEVLQPTLSAFRMYSPERFPEAGQPLLTGLAEATSTLQPVPLKEQRKRFLFF